MAAISRKQTAIGVSAQDVQALVGDDVEFLTEPSLVTVLLGQSATGLSVTVKADRRTLADDVAPNIVTAAGRLVNPEDMVVDQEFLPAGTRLKIVTDNTTAGALTLSHLVIVEEVPAEVLAQFGQ